MRLSFESLPRLPGPRWLRLAAPLLLGLLLAGILFRQGFWQGPEPYQIGVIGTMERSDTPFGRSTRLFLELRKDEINRAGGLGGVPVTYRFLSPKDPDFREQVERAAADPQVIALACGSSSTSADKIIDVVGRSGIPWIAGNFSLERLYRGRPNVFTADPGEGANMTILEAFLDDGGFDVVLYAGDKGNVFGNAIAGNLAARTDAPYGFQALINDWNGGTQTWEFLRDRIAAARRPIIVSGYGSSDTSELLALLHQKGVSCPLMPTYSDMISMLGKLDERIRPDVSLLRLQMRGDDIMSLEYLRSRERFVREIRRHGVQDDYVLRGMEYGDLVGVTAHAWRVGSRSGEASPREAILRGMAELQDGKGYYRGWTRDWAYTREGALDDVPSLLWKAPGSLQVKLYPVQYVLVGGQVRRSFTKYVHMDVANVRDVNVSTGTFDAEVNVSLQCAEPLALDLLDILDFSNVARSPETNRPLLDSVPLETNRKLGGEIPLYRSRYKVFARFSFTPRLAAYPFDVQEIGIGLRSPDPELPLEVQPANGHALDEEFSAEGWKVVDSLVGTETEHISDVDLSTDRLVQAGNTRYVFHWRLKRLPVDFLLKTVVPLAIILLLAYLSIFVSSEASSRVEIQAVCLLAVVALYFTVAKPSSGIATIYDKTFLLAYVSILAVVLPTILVRICEKRGLARAGIAMRRVQLALQPLLMCAGGVWLSFGC